MIATLDCFYQTPPVMKIGEIINGTHEILVIV